MKKNIAVVGAGIIGRLTALRLQLRGHQVTLFEKGPAINKDGCSYAAAGMIAPYCELETAEYLIARIGIEAYEIWPGLLAELQHPDTPVFFRQTGSLVIAHLSHGRELDLLKSRIAKHPLVSGMKDLDGAAIAGLEPELGGRYLRGLYYPYEACLDNRALLAALYRKLDECGVLMRFGCEVSELGAGGLRLATGQQHSCDLVVDCRGLAAKERFSELRGIRGELVIVDAPDVSLNRPVRLLHPRYPVYIVPHGASSYFIGATAIEAEDRSPISVRTTLELLSAAYSVHPGFAEARIMETVTNLRPAFLDNTPRIHHKDGYISINGLYRHGFLMAPVVVESACQFIDGDSYRFHELFHPLEGGR